MSQMFKPLQSARVYLELITRPLGISGIYAWVSSTHSKQKSVEGDANGKEFSGVFVRKETALVELRRRYSSFESMKKRGIITETLGSMMLKLHSKVAVMMLEMTLHTKFTDTPEIWDTVDLSREILVGLQSGLTPKLPSILAW